MAREVVLTQDWRIRRRDGETIEVRSTMRGQDWEPLVSFTSKGVEMFWRFRQDNDEPNLIVIPWEHVLEAQRFPQRSRRT